MQSNILPDSPGSDTDTDELQHEVRTPRVAGGDVPLRGTPGDFAHLNKLQLQAIYRGAHTHGARPAEEHPLFLALSDRYVAIEDDGTFGAAYKLQERAANGRDWSTRVYVDDVDSQCGAMPPRVLIRADHPQLCDALRHFTLEPEVSEPTRTLVSRAFAGVPDSIWNFGLVPQEHPLLQSPEHFSSARRLYVTSIDERTSFADTPAFKYSSPYEASTQSVPVADAAVARADSKSGLGSSRISGNVLVTNGSKVSMCQRDMLMLALFHNAFYGKASAAEARWVAENLMFRKGHPEDLRTIGIAFAFPVAYDSATNKMVPDDSAYVHSANLVPANVGRYSSVLKYATRNASPNCWPSVGVPVVRLAFLGLDETKTPNYLNGSHASKKLYPLVHQMLVIVHQRIYEMNLQSDYAAFLKACPLSKTEKDANKVSFMNLRRDAVREIDKLDPRLKATLPSGSSVPPDWPLEDYREAVGTFINRVAALPIGTAWVRTRSPFFPEGIRFKRSTETAAHPPRMVVTGAGSVELRASTPEAPVRGPSDLCCYRVAEPRFTQQDFQKEREEAGTNPVISDRMEFMLEPYAWLPQRRNASEWHLKTFPKVYDSEWEVQLMPLLHKKEEALNGATLLDPNEYFGTPKASVVARYVLWVLKTRFGTHVGPKINVHPLPTHDEVAASECSDPCVLNSVIKKLIRRVNNGGADKEAQDKQAQTLKTCEKALDDALAGLKKADDQCKSLNDTVTALQQSNDGHKRKADSLDAENKRLKTEAGTATADAANCRIQVQELQRQLTLARTEAATAAASAAAPAAPASSSRKLVATPGKDVCVEFAPARAASSSDYPAPDSLQTLRFKVPRGALTLMTPAPNGLGCRPQDLSRFDQREISIVFTPALE
jgi:hypothetical protein